MNIGRSSAVLGALLVAATVVAGCGGRKQARSTGASAAGCRDVAAPAPRRSGGQRPPRRLLDATKTYDAVIRTNCGSFTIRLDTRDSPHASASFVNLARRGYYNATIFHRIVPGYVIQGGDPSTTGLGNPGYATTDAPPAAARYTRGVVAMSKARDTPAGTAGGQFFIVTARDARLRPENALLGRVVRGLPTVLRIARFGDRSGRPTQTIVVANVSIHVSRATTPATTTSAAAAARCKTVRRPAPKPNGGYKPPTKRLDATKRYDAVVRTSCGTFTIRLDVKRAPVTAASFVALARAHLFDGTFFHRVVPGFVIQGGDPTGTGNGGPGYTVVEPPPRTLRYTRGVVAMAKTPNAPAGASGSQFFVVTARDATLPTQYALLGRVVSGLDVVEAIGRLGNPQTQQPTRIVVVDSIAIRAS